jgi:hypothetical protein
VVPETVQISKNVKTIHENQTPQIEQQVIKDLYDRYKLLMKKVEICIQIFNI